MSTNINTNNKRKREYIQITSKIMESEGVKGVSIRRVAKESGCTSAVLYKHFVDLQHLITVASVRFLEPYIAEFRRVSKREDLSSIQLDLYLWKVFITEAFLNRPYYEIMFFGKEREMLEECIYEYYTFFPDVEKDLDGFGVSIIFSSNLREREYMRLRRAAHEGLISMDNAGLLSRLSTAVFRGIFIQYDYDEKNNASLRLAADDCFSLVENIFQKYVNQGTNLDITNI